MILQSLESITLARIMIFKMASDCHYPLLLFLIKIIIVCNTKIKFSVFLPFKVSNMNINSKIRNYCEDQDIQDGVR